MVFISDIVYGVEGSASSHPGRAHEARHAHPSHYSYGRKAARTIAVLPVDPAEAARFMERADGREGGAGGHGKAGGHGSGTGTGPAGAAGTASARPARLYINEFGIPSLVMDD